MYLRKLAVLTLGVLGINAGVFAQTISSVEELALVAVTSGQTITMTPGVYEMEDYLTPTVISNTPTDSSGRSAMITFSGSNNTFDFTGVTIEVNTALLNDFGTKVIELHLTGDDITMIGLTVTDIGDSPTSKGGQSLTVSGDNITIEAVTLNVRGSSPYGYGDLLGKGSPNLVAMKKHSGMLIEGTDISIIGCSIYSRAFGHLFFIQGGKNVLFQDCYAEAVTRTTDDMLAETSGPAYDLDFAAVYANYDGDKVITPGYTKSLSECGYRIYGSGAGGTTGAVTTINCTAKDTRIGFAFTNYGGGDVLIQNCEATGCEAAYNVEKVTIENSRGDAVNGPLLYLTGSASTIELDLIPNVNTTTLHAIACINGSGHEVTLNTYENATRPVEHSILLGASRPAGTNPFSPLGTATTTGVTLYNYTGMPVEAGSTVSSCAINSNGTVTDNGSGNTIINLPSDGDLTFDKKVNLEDVAELSQGWQSVYTMNDLLEIAANWLNGTTTNTVTVQENETGYCSADGTVDNNNGGYTGSGFVNTDNAVGMGIDWSIDGDDGLYTMTWRYANAGDARPGNLMVNGATVSSDIPFVTTGDWSTWATQTVDVTLSSGTKSVRLEATGNNGLANIDHMEITGPGVVTMDCN